MNESIYSIEMVQIKTFDSFLILCQTNSSRFHALSAIPLLIFLNHISPFFGQNHKNVVKFSISMVPKWRLWSLLSFRS